MKIEFTKTVSLFLILFVLLLLGMVNAPTFTAHYHDFFIITTDTTFSHTLNVFLGEQEITSGANVCRGALTIYTTNTSTFAKPPVIDDKIQAKVSCVYSLDCRPYSFSESSYPANIVWISSTAYHSNITFFSQRASWCRTYEGLQPPHPLGPYVLTARYYNYSGEEYFNSLGSINWSVFCYGSTDIYSGGSVISSPFTPPAGPVTIESRFRVENCSVFARAYQQPAGGDEVADCIYSPPSGTYPIQLTKSISFTVYNGANITNTTPLTIVKTPGSNVASFSITLKNNGDVNVSITSLELTGDLTIISFADSPPFTIPAGETKTITGTARVPCDGTTSKSATVVVGYRSAISLIGTCGDPKTASFTGSTTGMSGPNIVNVTPLTITKIPGSNVANFSINVTNNGDVAANLKSLSLSGISLISYTMPSTVGVGVVVRINGTARVACGGTIPVQLNVTYNSTVDIVGTCDEDRTVSFTGSTTGMGGPNVVNVTPLELVPPKVLPGSTVGFAIKVNNTGDFAASITSYAITGISSPSYATSMPAILAPGDVIELLGNGTAPATPGSYTATLTVAYVAAAPGLDGPCNDPPDLVISAGFEVFVPSAIHVTSELDKASIEYGLPAQVVMTGSVTIEWPDGSKTKPPGVAIDIIRDGTIIASTTTKAGGEYSVTFDPSGWSVGSYKMAARATYYGIVGTSPSVGLRVSVEPIVVRIVATPLIVRARWSNVTLNVMLSREFGKLIGTYSTPNITIWKYDGAWTVVRPKEDIYPTAIDDRTARYNTLIGVHDKFGDDWKVGVYKIVFESYDTILKQPTSGVAYFVIFDFVRCEELI